MNTKFEFLKSTRFWSLVIGAVSIYLQSKGWIGEAEMQLLATLAGGFITVKTIDRAFEQKVVAAGVSSGTVTATEAGLPPTKE